MNVVAKSDQEIEQWIANYEAKRQTDAPFFRELLEERAKRSSLKLKLDVEKSLSWLVATARAQTCTTYGALAAANGVEWAKARRAMDGPHGHLDRLLDLCHARGLPLLTAICVSQGGVATGELQSPALKGFCNGARRLGLSFVDERAFHGLQRDACWVWGRAQASADE